MGVVFAENGLFAGFFLPGDSLPFLAGAFVAGRILALPIWLVAAGVFAAALSGRPGRVHHRSTLRSPAVQAT
jgi:membrane protein DedA with SNARE-associated domain